MYGKFSPVCFFRMAVSSRKLHAIVCGCLYHFVCDNRGMLVLK